MAQFVQTIYFYSSIGSALVLVLIVSAIYVADKIKTESK